MPSSAVESHSNVLYAELRDPSTLKRAFFAQRFHVNVRPGIQLVSLSDATHVALQSRQVCQTRAKRDCHFTFGRGHMS